MSADTFVQDTEVTPVLFRVHRSPKKYGDEVTAVFPCEPADYRGLQMTCYAIVGQHSGCDFGWYYSTRPATPEEYAEIKAELEAAPYGYRLKVCQRILAAHRRMFDAEVMRLHSR